MAGHDDRESWLAPLARPTARTTSGAFHLYLRKIAIGARLAEGNFDELCPDMLSKRRAAKRASGVLEGG